MTREPTNDWERAYQASIEAERERARIEDEQNARAAAMLPPAERRKRRRFLALFLVPMLMLLVAGIVVDGLAGYRVVSGHAVPGTVELARIVDVCPGRPPCVPYWEGRFRSDDGAVDRVVVFVEDVPGQQARRGAFVRARWTNLRGDSVYLERSGAYRDWFWTTVTVCCIGLVVLAVALVVWRRRVRLRRKILSEDSVAPPTG